MLLVFVNCTAFPSQPVHVLRDHQSQTGQHLGCCATGGSLNKHSTCDTIACTRVEHDSVMVLCSILSEAKTIAEGCRVHCLCGHEPTPILPHQPKQQRLLLAAVGVVERRLGCDCASVGPAYGPLCSQHVWRQLGVWRWPGCARQQGAHGKLEGQAATAGELTASEASNVSGSHEVVGSNLTYGHFCTGMASRWTRLLSVSPVRRCT